jgi:hypothetical protein
MNTVYLLGAGASHSYTGSYSGVRPPLANDFFRTYTQLPISEDFEVRVGDIINYIRDVHGISWQEFDNFNMNAEAFMTELDDNVRVLADKVRLREFTSKEQGNFFSWVKAYDQMIFLFAHVLNETQNGPVSKQYSKFVSICDDGDVLITFNWDTLLDRALYESGGWVPDTGYLVKFRNILDGDWKPPSVQDSKLVLLKLHGSTNWLINYVTRHLSTGERVMAIGQPAAGRIIVEADMGFFVKDGKLRIKPEVRRRRWGCRPVHKAGELATTPCCLLRGPIPFRTYKNRYRFGYEDFCYFFPPNDPTHDIPMMPLIVPPTGFKLYDEFEHVLDLLWEEAERRMATSSRVVIIGYSFPSTDHRVVALFRQVASRGADTPVIQIVNPSPNDIYDRLVNEIGIKREYVQVAALTFDDFLQL